MGGALVGVVFHVMIHIPLKTRTPNRRRFSFAGGDPVFGRVSRDRAHNSTQSRRGHRITKTEECEDKWIWQDETTLVRVHNTPRRRMFVPKEAEFPPCKLNRFRDVRETYQVFQSSGRTFKDSWRLAGNNIERTNRRNEFWTGTTNLQDHIQC